MHNYRNPRPISKQMEGAILSKIKYNETGNIWVETSEDDRFYIAIKVTIRYRNETISLALSRLIFFLANKIWPAKNKHIDHIDDNPLNNSPSNLQEITVAENMFKKRGKGNSRFGKNKYGHGISVYYLTKRNSWVAERSLGRRFGFDNPTKKHVAIAKTLEELEEKIKLYIENLTTNSLDIFEEDDGT